MYLKKIGYYAMSTVHLKQKFESVLTHGTRLNFSSDNPAFSLAPDFLIDGRRIGLFREAKQTTGWLISDRNSRKYNVQQGLECISRLLLCSRVYSVIKAIQY